MRKSECFGLLPDGPFDDNESGNIRSLLAPIRDGAPDVAACVWPSLPSENCCWLELEPVSAVALTNLRHLICGLGWPPARQLITTFEFKMAEVDLGGSMK